MSLKNIFKRKSAQSVTKSENFYSKSRGFSMGSFSNISWSLSDYESLSREGYMKNVVAYRCVKMIASSAACIGLKVFETKQDGQKVELINHEISNLLEKPNLLTSQVDFLEEVYSYLSISGNAYILAKMGSDGKPFELSTINPMEVVVLAQKDGTISGYRHKTQTSSTDYSIDQITGKCQILHIKNFHPLDKYYGLSPMEVSRFAIDLHNSSASYTKALLENSARPSGALIVKPSEFNLSGTLTDEQFERLKDQMDEHVGSPNTGKPFILEGGLEWKEMSISPKDMDFIASKNSFARDIALAFGVPSQLAGLEGDAKYNNFEAARIALWEGTILPLLNDVTSSLSKWISSLIQKNIIIQYDIKEADNLVSARMKQKTS